MLTQPESINPSTPAPARGAPPRVPQPPVLFRKWPRTPLLPRSGICAALLSVSTPLCLSRMPRPPPLAFIPFCRKWPGTCRCRLALAPVPAPCTPTPLAPPWSSPPPLSLPAEGGKRHAVAATLRRLCPRCMQALAHLPHSHPPWSPPLFPSLQEVAFNMPMLPRSGACAAPLPASLAPHAAIMIGGYLEEGDKKR